MMFNAVECMEHILHNSVYHKYGEKEDEEEREEEEKEEDNKTHYSIGVLLYYIATSHRHGDIMFHKWSFIIFFTLLSNTS